MLGGHGFRRSSRPVEQWLAQALAARGEEIAKRWVVELVERTPLQHTRGMLLEDLSAYATGWVDLVCVALGDDRAFERLAAHGLVPVIDANPSEVLRGLDALQAAVWVTALDELRSPDPRQVAEVSERLGKLIESLRAVAAEAWEGEEVAPGPGVLPPDEPPGRRSAPRAAPEHVLLAARLRAVSEETEERSAPSAPDATGGSSGAPEQARTRTPRTSQAKARRGRTEGERGAAADPEPADLSLQGGLWVRVLEDEIRDARLSNQRLALILIELEDVERLQASASAPELEVLLGRFVGTIRPLLRREDILALESWGKAWVVSPGTGRFTARLLAGGVADELAAAENWQGAPLRVSAGIAILGDDAEDAEGLIAVAEQEHFTASSRGVTVVEPETPSV